VFYVLIALHLFQLSSYYFFFSSYPTHRYLHSFPTRRSSDLTLLNVTLIILTLSVSRLLNLLNRSSDRSEERFSRERVRFSRNAEIGRAVQQECRDRSRMPSSA